MTFDLVRCVFIDKALENAKMCKRAKYKNCGGEVNEMEIGASKITKKEVIQVLEREKTLTLATCAGNRVTIRPMSHISNGMTILFQTGVNSLKMQQIRVNPSVAICVGTYEIEGTAVEVGHPLEKDNEFFAKTYREKHPDSFEKYSAYDDEVVVMVTVKCVRQWRYNNGQPVMAELSFD